MSAVASPSPSAARAPLGLVALLLAVAGLAWWSSADRMAGMDQGPGTDLGAPGWFVGIWVVMTAAMMFPSVTPTVALYARMAPRRGLAGPLAFTAGYLVSWTVAGVVAYAVAGAGRATLGGALAWDQAGRLAAGATLLVAAAYELTSLKDVCLARCRSPLGFLIGSWRDGCAGAVRMGAGHGAWCVGCCWALMAALFALGVMSPVWMAFVAALIAGEKALPWGRPAVHATAAVLVVMGVVLLVAPETLPGFVVPGEHGRASGMGGDAPAMPMR
jgi:predicted metal-binding membrane protein